jgi:deoxycytidylate deaminase
MADDSQQGPELIAAVVGPIGTHRELIISALIDAFSRVNYKCGEPIRLTDLFQEIPKEPWNHLQPNAPEDERYKAYIEAGDRLRELVGGSALASAAIGAIREERAKLTGKEDLPAQRRVYILWSLKHPEEAKVLREIYGPRLLIVAAYHRRDKRLENLAKKIADSRNDPRPANYEDAAGFLIKLDETEAGRKFGQKVQDTFPLADVFIDASNPSGARASVSRFVELVFGNTEHTPYRDEYGMFHAQGVSLRSGAVSRQVGAVIAEQAGEIISLGTNEVPKAGGGSYWSGDSPDKRDISLDYDPGERLKRMGLADVLRRLIDANLLPQKTDREINDLVEEALTKGDPPMMKNAQLMNLIEYGRAVHAEMAAIIDAARRGTSVRGGVLYTTTFPCHDCARHIVAAGIRRVVFIEPYPKSLAPEFHKDSIVVDGPRQYPEQVSFEPFVGIAPRRYFDFFSMLERKDRQGRVLRWVDMRLSSQPRFVEASTYYLIKEDKEYKEFQTRMGKNGLL